MERESESAAGRWLGIAVAAAPAIEVADTSGLFTALASPASFAAADLLRPLLQVGFFCAIGVAAAWLLRRHRPTGQRVFVAACAVPVAVWILYREPTLLGVIPLLAFALCVGHLRR